MDKNQYKNIEEKSILGYEMINPPEYRTEISGSDSK